MTSIENGKLIDPLIAVGAANNRAWVAQTLSPNSEAHHKAICDLSDLLAYTPGTLNVILDLHKE